jgi:hypothetical protein
MPAARVAEPVDILEDTPFGLATCVPAVSPDQLGLDGLEECFDHRIVITVPPCRS